jgi:hypothetical protein
MPHFIRQSVVWPIALLALGAAGCGAKATPVKPVDDPGQDGPFAAGSRPGTDSQPESTAAAPTESARDQESEPKRPRPRTFAEGSLSDMPATEFQRSTQQPAAESAAGDSLPPRPPRQRPIDPDLLQAQGIRQLQGQHLTLYTDLPPDPDVDNLCQVFDLAFPQWCDYFGVDTDDPAVAAWHMNGCLMGDKTKFWACGLWNDELPPFRFGYSQGNDLWLYEQPSAYYRRHLLLHEGTHGFMAAHVPAPSPAWHAEGMAELLGTHRWRDGTLTLRYFPQRREDAPEWGRIKLVKEAYEALDGLLFDRVLEFGPRAHLDVEPYGWCWAAAALLDAHPRYRERFRALTRADDKQVANGGPILGRDLNSRLREAFADDWDELVEDWQVFVGNLEYGYDVPRAAVEFSPGEPLSAEGAQVEVATDRGWQSSGMHLEAGKAYALKAEGRYQLASGPPVWWCEPNGVSIRYHQGRPLGVLQAAVRPDRRDADALSALLQPHEVGTETRLLPTEDGTLYLRVNDSPAELADNVGTIMVDVREVPADKL